MAGPLPGTAENEFVVVGFERQPGQAAFALLAREDAGRLNYAGSAFATLGGAEGERFWRRAADLASDEPALKELRTCRAQWLRPEMRVRARHLKGSDKLRHATVAGSMAVRTCLWAEPFRSTEKASERAEKAGLNGPIERAVRGPGDGRANTPSGANL